MPETVTEGTEVRVTLPLHTVREITSGVTRLGDMFRQSDRAFNGLLVLAAFAATSWGVNSLQAFGFALAVILLNAWQSLRKPS